MAKKSEINKKGRLAKSTLSVVLAASMVLTSSSFVWAAPADIAIVEEGDAVVETVEAPAEEAVGASVEEVSEASVEENVRANADENLVAVEDITDVDYNGQAQTPAVTVKYNGTPLVKDTDYTVAYYNNTKAGVGVVNADGTATGPYAEITFIGTTYGNLKALKKEFTINQLNLENAKVSYSNIDSFIYNGEDQYPAIGTVTYPVTVNGQLQNLNLTSDDYEVAVGSKGTDLFSVENQKSVTITAKTDGNFIGTAKDEKEYSIEKASINSDKVDVKLPTFVFDAGYDADDIANMVVATDKKKEDANAGSGILDPAEYTVEFLVDGVWVRSTAATPSDDVKVGSVGTHQFRIVTSANCENYVEDGKIEGSYEVVANQSLQMLVDGATLTYGSNKGYNGDLEAEFNGTDKFPDITRIGALGKNVGYKVTTAAAEWKEVGSYILEIAGLGNYTGQTATLVFKINPKKLNSGAEVVGNDISVEASQGVTHSGQPSSLIVTVKDTINGESVELVKDKDYTYVTEASGNKTYVIITGIGNYTTVLSKTITTLKVEVQKSTTDLSLNDSSISATVKTSYTYTGGKKEPKAVTDIEVIENDTTPYTLTANDYYVLRYGTDNTSAGEGTVTIKGKGRYTGERTIKFNIAGLSFAETFEIDPASVKDIEYTGADVKAAVERNLRVQFISTKAKYTQYDVEYYSNGVEVKGDVKDIGTYTLKVVPRAGQYEGSLEATFKVIGKDIAKVATVSEIKDQEFTGKAIEPEMKVALNNGKALVKDTDYTVTYDKNTEVGTAYVTITGIGTYSGEIVKSFKIIGTDISKATVAVDGTYTYTGKEVVPTVVVKLDDAVIDATNYDVKATDNVNAGTAKVTVTGKGGFTGTTEAVEFTIAKADQKLAVSKAIADALKIRNTNANTYTLKVTGAGTALSYTSSNTKVASVSSTGKLSFKHVCGKATITVTAAADDNHNAATLKVAVAVKPATPKITVTARAKGFNAKATTIKDITGYQVGYSTDKSFAASKTKKQLVKTTKALNKNFSGLSAKKGYYVRVRAYKIASDGTVYWGNWTSAKKITTK